jgi:sulfoxide reductase heme-binding subunit YedZ
MSAAAIAPIWVTARAAGIAALLAASASASLGLLGAMRPAIVKGRRIELRTAHEALALGTIALIALHAVALLADPVLRPGIVGLIVPFAGSYKPLATALGQLAAVGMTVLALTYYVRRWLGAARWRAAHRFIAGFWVLGVLHALLAGSDAGRPWFVAAVLLPAVTAGALLYARHARPPARSASL